ncbi:MAG: 2,3-diphosphoglycerate-dependent phosphoglycerate mutase [Aerococcus sp.]|nr:2,3-diphosphoglycerate-dependent phosphoglycerate mutase [Aerococcus sp.]
MKLILVRHGQSESNLNDLFTGWADPSLTDQGIEQAKEAGRLLNQTHILIDEVHTSLMTRTNQTVFYLLREMDCLWLPVYQSWRLNGRHYGQLEGQNKQAMREKYGDKQIALWRRGYDAIPPQREDVDDDRRYRYLDSHRLPIGESLKQTQERLVPYLEDVIFPALKHDKNILIVSHGNLLRAMTMFLENISPDRIDQIEINTAEPIVYDINALFEITNKNIYYRH